MIKWFKRNQEIHSQEPLENQAVNLSQDTENNLDEQTQIIADAQGVSREGIFARIKKGLSKTRHQLGEGIGRLLLGKKEINNELLEELETLLISADLGIDTTQELLKQVTDGLKRQQLSNGESVFQALKEQLLTMISPSIHPLSLKTDDGSPFVILMVGINGAGKTTTIGKLAKQYQMEGKKVMLAAGDTFRAAAIEQLEIWGERNGIPVIAQQSGADSASVLYDALQSARAKKIDILIADTAGRLHTQTNLMEELKKLKRVLQKQDPNAPHEIMLVLDASIGQNALTQAKQFHEAIGVTGITMTKLDGTAKGGILFAISHDLGIPFRYIGVGEGIEDLRPFNAAQFVGAIFDDDHI